MKLLFFLILIFLKSSIEYKTCKIYDSITKTKSLTITPGNNQYCVFLDTNEFSSNIETIEIYIIYSSDRIFENYIYYDLDNYKPNVGETVSVHSFKYYDYYSYSNYFNEYKEDITNYFKIPKLTSRYMILSIPKSSDYLYRDDKVKIGVSNVPTFETWKIILIVVSAIIIISITIIAIICIRIKRSDSNISPLNIPTDNKQTKTINDPMYPPYPSPD